MQSSQETIYKKRNWQGDPSCLFCDSPESVSHILFECYVARVIWSIVARCFGANNIPSDLNQCWLWCDKWFPGGRKFHPCGVGAICWAIWKARNKACFQKK